MLRKTFLVTALTFVFACIFPVAAQVWTPMPAPKIDWQNQIWRNFRMGQIGNQMAADLARARGGAAPKGRAGRPAAPPVNSAVYQKQFAFRRSQSSPLVEKMASLKSGTTQAEKQQIQAIVDDMWSKYQISFADENARLGMPFEDTATAMTYYIVLSYIYAYDLKSLESEYSVAVYKQVASILSKDPEFAKLAAADKQLLAELLVTMGGMPAAVYDRNRSNVEKMAAGRANLERIFGNQTSNLRITANGVEF